MKSLSLIVPAHNEEKRILDSLESYLGLLNKHDEIIVVCNGCIDNTFNLVNEFLKKHKNIRFINIDKRIGKGAAILNGFNESKKEYIGFLDADNSFNLDHIKNMIKDIKTNKKDMIIASKWKDNSFFKVPESFMRKIAAIGWNFLTKLLFGLNFKDTQAGAKFFNRKVIDSINLNFICTGFDFDVELLYKVKEKGFNIEERHITSTPMEFSTFHLKYVPKMFFNLIRFWRSSL